MTVKGLINGGIIFAGGSVSGLPVSDFFYKKFDGSVVLAAERFVKNDKKYYKFPRNFERVESIFPKGTKFEYYDKRIEGDNISFNLSKDFSLRDYQKEPVKSLVETIKSSKEHSCILQAEPSFGKSYILPKVVLEVGKRTLILVDRDLLRDQMFEEFTKNSTAKVVKLTSDTTEFGDVNITTFQLLLKNKELVKRLDKHIGFVVVDECFDGNTEIFTEKGWIRFDELSKGVKVAEVLDNNEFIFTKPTKYIKRKQKELVNVASTNGRGFNMSATSGHRQVINDNEIVTFDNLPKTFKVTELVTPKLGKSGKKHLSTIDRLRIAIQADGTMVKTGAYIKVSKPRKVKRLTRLLKSIEHRIIKYSGGLRVFIPFSSMTSGKLLEDFFTLSEFSTEYAKEFIDEVSRWDGHRYKKYIYYSSTCKRNADFVSAVSVIAGYTARQSIQIDNRKESYKDVHRVNITLGARKAFYMFDIKKSAKTTQNGYVYCVSVPSTKILVRQQGRQFVTGNCHVAPAEQFLKVVTSFGAKYRLGLSATPTRSDGLTPLITDTFSYNKVIGNNPNNLKIFSLVVDTRIPVFYSSRHKMAEAVSEALLTKKVYNKMTTVDLVVEASIKLLKKGRKVLVYTTYNDVQEAVRTGFISAGYSCGVINGDTKKKDREVMMQDFQDGKLDFLVSGVILQKGVSIHKLDTIINISSQNKEALEQVKGRLRRESPNKKFPMFIHFTFSGKMEQNTISIVDQLVSDTERGDKFKFVRTENFLKLL